MDDDSLVPMRITLLDYYVLDGTSKCYDLRAEIKNQGGQAVYAGDEFIGWRINKIQRKGTEHNTLTAAGLKMQPIPGSEKTQLLN